MNYILFSAFFGRNLSNTVRHMVLKKLDLH